MPTCKSCGRSHFNFQTCGEAAHAARPPDRFHRPREGERDFGDRFNTMTGRNAGGVITTLIPRTAHPMYVKPEPPKEAA